MAERIAISKIRTDGGTQSRQELNAATVDEYTESVRGKAKFPAVTVYYDGAAYWLADGFHRLQAHRNAQKRAILADVRQGNLRDAILHSAGANATHGLRRSNDDKRRAVMCLLDDPEWSQWSDRAIAKRCNVSHVFVGKLRPDTGNVTSIERQFTHPKTGEASTMTMKNKQAVTANIDAWIRYHYDTSDPASIASHARYCVNDKASQEAIRKMLILNHSADESNSSIIASLIILANKYQDQVISQAKSVNTMTSDAREKFILSLHLSIVANKLHVDTREFIKLQCQQEREGGLPAARDFWHTLQELLS